MTQIELLILPSLDMFYTSTIIKEFKNFKYIKIKWIFKIYPILFKDIYLTLMNGLEPQRKEKPTNHVTKPLK